MSWAEPRHRRDARGVPVDTAFVVGRCLTLALRLSLSAVECRVFGVKPYLETNDFKIRCIFRVCVCCHLRATAEPVL